MPSHCFCCFRSLPHSPTTLVVALLLLFLTSCAQSPRGPFDQVALYIPPPPASISSENTPTFLVKDPAKTFNKIGTPSVTGDKDTVLEYYVTPEKPAIYFETQEFKTTKGVYTNLIYRIHFQEVPLGWTSLNLTAGRNPGLLLIYTLDQSGKLLLVTTVHTCGCYLAFFPTEAMPRESLPLAWPESSQSVYGYTLPSSLKLPKGNTDSRIAFTLESETHRISTITVTSGTDRRIIGEQIQLPIFPMRDLFYLPYLDKTVSFFESEGSRKGYVKNNTKILEKLFLSWLALDLHVGEDKAFSIHDTSGTVFYTSLKFWARNASDLKDFPKFLHYWGWQL